MSLFGVARAVLQTLPLLIDWLSWSSFWLESLNSQTIRARDLKFWENVHIPVWNMSGFLCYVSGVIFWQVKLQYTNIRIFEIKIIEYPNIRSSMLHFFEYIQIFVWANFSIFAHPCSFRFRAIWIMKKWSGHPFISVTECCNKLHELKSQLSN